MFGFRIRCKHQRINILQDLFQPEYSDEIVDSFIHTQKDNQYAFPILALLFPHLDYKNYDFHKDHMHPKKAFENLDWDKIPDTQKEYYTPFWWNFQNLLGIGQNFFIKN